MTQKLTCPIPNLAGLTEPIRNDSGLSAFYPILQLEISLEISLFHLARFCFGPFFKAHFFNQA